MISYLILEDDWATHATMLSPLGKPTFVMCPNTTWVSKGPDGSVMMRSHLIERKPNPEDGRGVLIHLTEFGREKREYSRERVLTFNETIKNTISEERLNHFYEVAETITELVSNKKIYNQNDNSIK